MKFSVCAKSRDANPSKRNYVKKNIDASRDLLISEKSYFQSANSYVYVSR